MAHDPRFSPRLQERISPQLARYLKTSRNAEIAYREDTATRQAFTHQLASDIMVAECIDGRAGAAESMGIPMGAAKHRRKAGCRLTHGTSGYSNELTRWVNANPNRPNLLCMVLHRSTHPAAHHLGCKYWAEEGGGHVAATRHAVRHAIDNDEIYQGDLRTAVLCQITDGNALEVYDPGKRLWYVIPRYFNDLEALDLRARGLLPVPRNLTYLDLVRQAYPHWQGSVQRDLALLFEQHNAQFDPDKLVTQFGRDHSENTVIIGGRLSHLATEECNFVIGIECGGAAEQLRLAAASMESRLLSGQLCRHEDDRILVVAQEPWQHSGNSSLDERLLHQALQVAILKAGKWLDVVIDKRQRGVPPSRAHLIPRLEVVATAIDERYHVEVAQHWRLDEMLTTTLRQYPSPAANTGPVSLGDLKLNELVSQHDYHDELTEDATLPDHPTGDQAK